MKRRFFATAQEVAELRRALRERGPAVSSSVGVRRALLRAAITLGAGCAIALGGAGTVGLATWSGRYAERHVLLWWSTVVVAGVCALCLPIVAASTLHRAVLTRALQDGTRPPD